MRGINTLPARIRAKIDVTPAGCWEWTAGVKDTGYGVAWYDGTFWQAHRLVFTLVGGLIPDGHDVDHECHNRDKTCVGGWTCRHRRCVRPSHLRPRTRRDNLRRGRGSKKKVAP